ACSSDGIRGYSRTLRHAGVTCACPSQVPEDRAAVFHGRRFSRPAVRANEFPVAREGSCRAPKVRSLSARTTVRPPRKAFVQKPPVAPCPGAGGGRGAGRAGRGRGGARRRAGTSPALQAVSNPAVAALA